MISKAGICTVHILRTTSSSSGQPTTTSPSCLLEPLQACTIGIWCQVRALATGSMYPRDVWVSQEARHHPCLLPQQHCKLSRPHTTATNLRYAPLDMLNM